ncbi:serine hydrolase [Streptomyces sp. DW26H14]|uniref:serine hydrolase n=1 Tax=Streptomyces sp. DW26H14 TaxID=3435395 RepID=UPI00403DF800
MAGESPGKSEQQKSSGETVPDEREARAAAPREAEADGAGVAEANADARADAGADADAEADTDAEAAITGSAAAEAPEASEASGTPEPSAAKARKEASGDAESAESAEGSARDDASDDAPGDASGEAPGEDGDTAASAVRDTDAPADAQDGAGERPEAEGEGERGGEAAAPEGAADAASAASDAGSEGDPSGSGDEVSEPEAKSDSEAESGAGAVGEPEAEAESDSGAEPVAEPEAGSDPESGSEADAEAPSKPDAEAEAGAEAGAGAPSKTDAEAEGDSGDSGGGTGPKGDGGTGRGPKGAVPAQPTGKDDAPGAALPPAHTPGWAADRVDHPTTVIRTGPPSGKPPVDRPTTALKLPAEPPLNGGSPAASELAGSTFVPLKRDDLPSSPASSSPASPSSKSPSAPSSPSSASSPASKTPAAQPWPSIPVPGKPAEKEKGDRSGDSGDSGGPVVPGEPGKRPGGSGGPGGPITPVIDSERTSVQPVPPRDPLDLLAELTNTPDTPVRVVARRFKIWTPLVVLLAIIYVVVQGVRPLPEPTLKMTAAATYSFAGDKPRLPWPSEGQGYVAAPGLGTMDSFGAEKPVPVGSVAKLMTAYLVLKDHPLKTGQNGPSITVDKQAAKEGGLDSEGESTLNTVKAGDKLTLKEALSALMVQSANNIARLLARWDAGSENAFVNKMNAEARALGMGHTTYTDPSGLESSTVSTAKDQVILGQKLVGIPALTAITVLPSWTDPSGTSHRNYNSLVPYNGAIGLKTGTTTAAGGNLVFAAHKVVDGKDQLIVGAVFAQHKSPIIDTVNAVSKTAMIAAEGELKRVTVVHKGQVVGEVDDGLGGTTPVVATADAKAVGWGGLTERLQLTAGSGSVPHTAKAGQRVGTLTVGNGLSSEEIPVAVQRNLVEPGFGAKLTHL